MYIAIEELRSLALDACGEAAGLDAVRAAKAHLGEAGVWVAEQAVQLHGAMGVTEECDVGQILKRTIVLDRLLGGADHHISRLGQRLLEHRDDGASASAATAG
jgi:pimeloyl-CoA dehydrogenase